MRHEKGSGTLLYIFGGLPGTGKSTLSLDFARERKAVHLRIDTIEQAMRNSPLPVTREAWRDVARNAAVPFVEIEVVCSDKNEHQRRVESRTSSVPGLTPPTWAQVSRHDYEPWDREHIVIDTANRTPEQSTDDLRRAVPFTVPISAAVTAVSANPAHTFSKENRDRIRLLTGLGVEGDAHMGHRVKHRSRVARDPNQPNLRQVHLIQTELFAELQADGFGVSAGQMGENITTRGIDLLALPTGTRLHIGETAIVEVTGLRNPCAQLDGFQSGLMAALLGRDEHGHLILKAGIMGTVVAGGEVCPGDLIRVALPPEPHRPLERV